MRLEYDRETDSLYIELRSGPSIDAREVEPGVIFDFGGDGRLLGIDIENASELTDVDDLPPMLKPKKTSS